MTECFLAGYHATRIAEHWDRSLLELASDAVLPILEDLDARPDAIVVGNMLSGVLNRTENLGAAIADRVGLRGIPAYKVEAACASGAAAIDLASALISSGRCRTVIALGIEKLTDASHADATAAMSYANDFESETIFDVTMPSMAALITNLYCDRYGVNPERFDHWVLRAYENAKSNPLAMYHSGLSKQQLENSTLVADPLRLFDCPAIADGAAAILLSSVPHNHQPSFQLAAINSATDSPALIQRRDLLELVACRRSAEASLQSAGLQWHEIDVIELHDTFPIMPVLAIESLHICDRGTGWTLWNNAIPESSRPCRGLPQCLGGIKGRGHPVGALGVYQLIDIMRTLGSQDALQTGLAQCMGGFGSNCFTSIVKKV